MSYTQNGQIFDDNGMVIGNAPLASSTQGRDPNYNPGFWGELWDGVTHPAQAWNAFENNTLAPAANAIGNTLKPITDPLNNLINNGGAAGAAVGAVLGTGVGVSSNGGVHQGMGAPALTPGTQNTDAMVDHNIAREQHSQSPVISNTLPGFNGATSMYPQLGAGSLGMSSNTLSPTGTTRTPAMPLPPVTPSAGRWYSKDGIDYGYDGKPLGAATNTASGGAPGAAGPTAPAGGNGGLGGLALPGLTALAPIVGGVVNAVGSKVAGDTQATAASEAAKLQSDQFNAWLGFQREQAAQQQKNITPWLNAGGGALDHLTNFNAENPAFSFSTTGPNADPSYAFRLDEGMKALQNSAAARGGLLSGNAMKGITNYAQGAASQEYNNAFNRYQTDRNVNLNRLQSLAGLGQTAVNQANQVSQNSVNGALTGMVGSANALANGVTGAADANASGYKGMTNALTNALGGYVQGQRQDSFINALGGY